MKRFLIFVLVLSAWMLSCRAEAETIIINSRVTSDGVTSTMTVRPSDVRAVAFVNGKFFMLSNTAVADNGSPIAIEYDANGNLIGSGWYTIGEGYWVSGNNGVTVNVPFSSAGPAQMANLRAALNAHCRGDSGNLKKTQFACEVRDILN